MAHLIDSLALSGARRANGDPVASGRAWFYVPGTPGTLATVYSDADGLVAASQPVALDAGGRCTVYTKTAVRVQIEDSNGNVQALSDRGNTTEAGEVEVENAGFTGTQLSTSGGGSQVAGGRTSLDTALSSLYASLGGVDGQYQITTAAGARIGAPRAVCSAVTDIAVNVKNFANTGGLPVRGDGAQVDTTGMQAAINYLSGVGGGVLLLPPGTYLIDQALLVGTSGINIRGAGQAKTIIKLTNATANAFTVSNASFFMEDLSITHSATSTGSALALASCPNVVLNRLTVDSFKIGAALTGTTSNTTISSCQIVGGVGGATDRCVDYNTTGSSVGHRIVNCSLLCSAGIAVNYAGTVASGYVSGSSFGASLIGVGFAAGTTGTGFVLVGNALSSCTTPIQHLAVNDVGFRQIGNGVDGYTVDVAGAGSATVDRAKGSDIRIRATGTTATVLLPVPIPPSTMRGVTLTLRLFNNAGAGVTWTLAATYHTTAAIPTTDGHVITLVFAWDSDAGVWREISRTDTT